MTDLIPVLLALAAAVCFGVSDYLSGVFSRRLRILDILVVGNVAGLLLLLALLPLFHGTTVATADLVWGACAGVAGALAVLLLLHGFRVGRFGVVSPVSSVGAAGIPVLAGLLLGEQPSRLAGIGLAVGIVSIWLVSSARPGPHGDGRRIAAGLREGLAAGVLLAVMLLALSRADQASGPWPVLSLQLGLLAVIGGAVAIRGQHPRVNRTNLPGVAAIGVTAVLGLLAFIEAARLGLVSIAAVIASMSPAVTVLLARMLITEHFTPRQVTGLAAAAVALVLIGLG